MRVVVLPCLWGLSGRRGEVFEVGRHEFDGFAFALAFVGRGVGCRFWVGVSGRMGQSSSAMMAAP